MARQRFLAVFAASTLIVLSSARAWDQDLEDFGDLRDNLIPDSAGQRLWETSRWGEQEPTPAASAASPGLICNYSDWQPLPAPWPERQQWSRVGQGDTAFRPSQPLAPASPEVSAPVRAPPGPPAAPAAPAPPCYAAVQLPLPVAGRNPQPFDLLYSPDALPHSDSGALTRCLWILVAPPGWNVTVSVSMGAWGSPSREPPRGQRDGAVRLYAQAADGDLTPVFSLRASIGPSQSSADVRSSVAVLSMALWPAASFSLRLTLTSAGAAAAAGTTLDAPPPTDTLQPPAATQRPLWSSGPWAGAAWATNKPWPGYAASSSHVDVESVDLTHHNGTTQQQTANCVLQQQHQGQNLVEHLSDLNAPASSGTAKPAPGNDAPHAGPQHPTTAAPATSTTKTSSGASTTATRPSNTTTPITTTRKPSGTATTSTTTTTKPATASTAKPALPTTPTATKATTPRPGTTTTTPKKP